MPVGEQAYKQLGGRACQCVGGPSTSAVFTAEVLLVSNWIPDHGHGSLHEGCSGPARSASQLQLIESRRQMGVCQQLDCSYYLPVCSCDLYAYVGACTEAGSARIGPTLPP